jgi:HD superfamily phosphohydrolase
MPTSPLIGAPNVNVGFVTLERPLGKPGEQGEVWLAHAKDFTTVKFAVKISRRPVSSPSDQALMEFRHEFSVLASLNHPHIVKVFHCDTFPKDTSLYPYYVMEYLGEKVAPFHEFYVTCPDEKKIGLCLTVLLDSTSALRHVHFANDPKACHQDIKASNIVVCPQGDGHVLVKLIDFGFSKLLPPSSNAFEIDAAGRATQKASSHHRPANARTPQHFDVWQLAYTLNKFFANAKHTLSRTNKNEWPIDYADFERVLQLLSDWESISPQNPAEAGEIDFFYKEIEEVSKHGSTSELGPDVKGATRYFSVAEISTAARIQPAFQAVRIPHRQLVLYTQRITELITRPEFGVLRYTRQLGFTHLVYPGAQGTRFEHALGVYNLACHFVIRLSGHSPFRRACGNPKEVLKFLLACILHDVGHFPFAHQIEEFKGKDNDFPNPSVWSAVEDLVAGHHVHGQRVIRSRLGGFLKDAFTITDEDIEDILLLISDNESFLKRTPTPLRQSIAFFRELLSGPIDLDKLDYIERDAHHCGVPYGSYLDTERVMETMHVVDICGTPLLAFDRRGIGCLEEVATARHQMFANVYWHRAVRAATAMFKHAFALFAELFPEKQRITRLFLDSGSDDAVLASMLRDANTLQDSEPRAVALRRLLTSISGKERILYKPVLQENRVGSFPTRYGSDYYANQRKVALKIFNALKTEHFFVPNVDELGGAHNVLIDCRHDSWPAYDKVKILDDQGTLQDLREHSPSVSRLESDFMKQACKIRVFVNPLVLNDQYRDKFGRSAVGARIRQLPLP